jgi:hypothetical protein
LQRSLATSPPGRTVSAFAYHAGTQRTVLFGGANAGGFLGDTWVYDGAIWSQAATTGGPVARQFTAMTAAPRLGAVVLFGGADAGNNPFGDTWAWNGSSWSQLAMVPPAPSPRRGPFLAFDGMRGQVLLFGGVTLTSSYFGDTWALR